MSPYDDPHVSAGEIADYLDSQKPQPMNKQPYSNVGRGRLRIDYYVTCGLCGDHAVGLENTATKATKNAKALGWSYTRANGWVCLRCNPKTNG
jgi:hypothetical protein